MEGYRVAGIDVHKKMLAMEITDAARPGEFQFERRRFGTGAAELRSLAQWLAEQEVREAVMESTALYWKPVWARVGKAVPSVSGASPLQPRSSGPQAGLCRRRTVSATAYCGGADGEFRAG